MNEKANMLQFDIREPSWKKWVVPVKRYLTPEQCDQVVEIGRSLPPEKSKIGNSEKTQGENLNVRKSTIAFIPKEEKFNFLYDKLARDVKGVNRDCFGFDNIHLFEQSQYTEYYGGGGHYGWHPDAEINGVNNGIVRKISLSILLNDTSEFEGGELELLTEGRQVPLEKGDAVFFASFLLHRVKPVIKGTRKSLVQWFTGTPFR